MRNPSTELPCILRVGEINDNDNPAALLPSYPAAQLTLSRVTRRNVNTEPHSPFVGFGSSEKRISFILNGKSTVVRGGRRFLCTYSTTVQYSSVVHVQ